MLAARASLRISPLAFIISSPSPPLLLPHSFLFYFYDEMGIIFIFIYFYYFIHILGLRHGRLLLDMSLSHDSLVCVDVENECLLVHLMSTKLFCHIFIIISDSFPPRAAAAAVSITCRSTLIVILMAFPYHLPRGDIKHSLLRRLTPPTYNNTYGVDEVVNNIEAMINKKAKTTPSLVRLAWLRS